MKRKFTKTPLLIAAFATALTIATQGPANADVIWAGATADTEIGQVYDAGFKHHGGFKHKAFKHKGFKHRSFKKKGFHGVKKKKHVSTRSLAKKKFVKKLF